MNSTKELRIDLAELLTVWNRHQDLRRNGADIAELAASRAQLDLIRFA